MRRLPHVRTAAALATLSAALALSACAVDQAKPVASERGSGVSASVATAPLPAPGGIVRTGESLASMAEQYTPRVGPVAATGASAWVKQAPAPAFVAEGPPPAADPPAPPLAAVANRQPTGSPSPSTPASDVVRPEAAQPEAPAPAPAAASNDALRTAGRELFNNFSCGTCHIFADANGGGSIGPSLDRNARMTRSLAIDVITHGSGAMPSFAGQMSDEEIETLADYLVQFARK